MKEIIADPNLVAYCGLYCGACGKYLRDKCPGCKKNEKAGWCQVRVCCISSNYLSCADCKTVKDVSDCKKFNNFISKIFAFLFRSNRRGCINLIAEKGYERFAKQMAEGRKMTISL